MNRKGHPAWNKGKRGRFWYTNGVIDKVFYPEDAPTGWIKGRCKIQGRVQSEEEKERRRQSYDRSKHPEHFKLTDEQKQNLSNAKKRFYGSIR